MSDQMFMQTNGEEKKPTCSKIKVDPTSEILSPDDCQTIGNWLPDWAQGDYLNCIFQASKHGYKYVCHLQGLSFHCLFSL